MKIDALTREVTLTEKEYRNLALTWEDIKLICEIEDRYWNEEYDEDALITYQTYYEEVLRRFNETRK